MSEPRKPTGAASADYVREFIAETASRAAVYAAHAQNYADLGDDRGLARAMRMLATTSIAGCECLQQLHDAQSGDDRLRQAAAAVYGPQDKPPVELNPGKESRDAG